MAILVQKDIETNANYILTRMVNLFLLKIIGVFKKNLIDRASGITEIK